MGVTDNLPTKMTDNCHCCGELKELELYTWFSNHALTATIGYMCTDCWVIIYGKGRKDNY